MPQIRYDVPVGDKAAADELVKKTENIQGVKFVNVGADGHGIVVTHGDITIKIENLIYYFIIFISLYYFKITCY